MQHTAHQEATITIILAVADYQKPWQKAINRHAQQAALKGFRKGSVPPQIILQKQGQEVLYNTAHKLAYDAMKQHCVQAEIKPLTPPLVTIQAWPQSLEKSKLSDITFVFHIGTTPSYKVVLDKTIKVPHPHITSVEEQEAEQALQRLQRAHGTVKQATSLTTGHEIHGSLHKKGGEEKYPITFLLTPKLVTLQPSLLDLSESEEITLHPPTIATLLQDPTLPKVTKHYLQEATHTPKLRLARVLDISPAPLDQPFFDKAIGKGKVTSKESCIAHLKEILRQDLQQHADQRLHHHIRHYLVQNIDLPLPTPFLKKWLQAKQKEALDPKALDSQYENHIKQKKWQLIAEKIAQEHSIQPNKETVRTHFQRYIFDLAIRQNGATPTPQKLKNSINALLKQHGDHCYQHVHNQQLEEAIIAHIKKKITLDKQPMDSKAYAAYTENSSIT